MVGIVLWVRMVGFTALFVSVPLAYLAYRQRPFRWLRSHVVLTSAQAFFDLVFTFTFFADLLFQGAPRAAHPLFSALQAVVSMVLIFYVPRLVQRLLGWKRGWPALAWSLGPVLLLLLGYLFVVLPVPFNYDLYATVAFYLYLSGWLGYGLVRRGRIRIGEWRPWVLTFLVGGALFHLLAAVELLFGPWPLTEEGGLPSILLTSSLFNTLWAVTVMVPAIRTLLVGRHVEGAAQVSEAFVREFGLSRRESEVLAEICGGLSNKDIAEKLFVSPRTVENHVYNLYRKCGVRRRLELCNLLHRFL